MAFCKIADVLYAAIPLRPFRDLLIRGHMERCPHCQARLVGPEEARGLLVSSERIGDPMDLWRRISFEAGRNEAFREPRQGRPSLAWRWASTVATAVILAATGFWLLRQVEQQGIDVNAIAPADRFEISYVRVGGAPAQTFVYQPQGTDTVFVWASRIP
jgi:hypothetical protein